MGGLVNGVGVYTAPNAEGFYHVIATSVEDPTVSASATSFRNDCLSFILTHGKFAKGARVSHRHPAKRWKGADGRGC